jgi:hypothetical protein
LDWIEQLEISYEAQRYDKVKLFKITRLNLQNKAKNKYKKFQLTPIDWNEMKIGMQQKFGDVDLYELRMKMDEVKQEPR